MPASLWPAQITFMSACGCGLMRQSSILKCSPLKSDWPVPQRSRSTWMYSLRYW
ncbi:Uncharacterised protein [Mycobacterium tuberculosis]|nr:Uncharacterised protein [Mycobacterium tuberculosis]